MERGVAGQAGARDPRYKKCETVWGCCIGDRVVPFTPITTERDILEYQDITVREANTTQDFLNMAM